MRLSQEAPSTMIEGVIPISLHQEQVVMAMLASATITAAVFALLFLLVFEFNKSDDYYD
jgi:hypothetical protein